MTSLEPCAHCSERARRHAQLVDLVPDAHFITDRHGKIREANACAGDFFGVSPSALRCRSVASFVEPRRRRAFLAELRVAGRSEPRIGWEVHFARPSGETLKGLCRVAPLGGGRRPWIGLRWLVSDAGTAAGATELRRLSRAKDLLLARVAHELRTPLTAVFGWLQVARELPMADERMAHALEVIERSARAEARMIDELVDVSRVASGKLWLERETLDVRQPVLSALRLLEPQARQSGATLSVSVPSTEVPVHADAHRLEQVVWNLVANAIKFTPAPGRIEVAVQAHEGRVRIGVRDWGVGIPAALLGTLFDPFRQDEDDPRRHAGLGLGLAISRGIAEAHGGVLRAESDGPGRGATFVVELPMSEPSRAMAAAPVPERRRAPRQLTHAPRPMRVLVVEGHADTRDVVAAALRHAGMDVAAAATSAEAVAHFRAAPAEIIVTDLAIPGEDGFSLLRRLRHDATSAGHLKVAVAITGYATAETRAQARRAGFDECLIMPVSMPQLTAAIVTLSQRAARAH